MKTARKLLLTLLICSSCVTLDKKDIWVGDPDQEAIVNKDNKTMWCSEETFKQMTCVGPENLAKIKVCMAQCKE